MKFLSLMLTLFSFYSIAAEIGCPNAEAELAKDEKRIEESRSSADEQLEQIAEFEAQNNKIIEIYQSHLDFSQLDANTRPKYQSYVNEAKESLLELARLREQIASSEEQLRVYELKAMKLYRESCSVETRINTHSRASEETTKLSLKIQKEAKLRNLCKEMNKGWQADTVCVTNVGLSYMNMTEAHIYNCSILSNDRYKTCLGYGGRIELGDINDCNKKYWDNSFDSCIFDRAWDR